MSRKTQIISIAIVFGICLFFGAFPLRARSGTVPQIIKVSARRFQYNPNEIVLKRGVPVVLQLTTEDRSHGFNIPSMNVRTEISPGKTSDVSLTPDKSGEFDFFCDVFCGSGHENMSGKIRVVD